MKHWIDEAIFYHIYPLGLCGAPEQNDFCSPAVPRLEKICGWLDHIQSLGANAIYLGPLFESDSHGYDTLDYFWVDRRLGTNDTLKKLSNQIHARGMRLVLDGVFNHVGRHFWAFRDLLERGESSPYRGWFHNLRFDRCSPYGDPFSYDGWNSHYNLVKLNLANPDVKAHLFLAVESWMRDYHIDGLRLDAADCLPLDFLHDLSSFCRQIRPDFWLMGEIIHGDYRRWANPQTLDSVTNYECYKGLFSSHVDANYFEIAYSLNRQFGEMGLYRDLSLYAFADNHDVERVASSLKNPAHLFPLYTLLFAMPGIPSLYYGSEFGIPGKKVGGDDRPLRPTLYLEEINSRAPQPELAGFISRLARIRQGSEALKTGIYRQALVDDRQFAFFRETEDESILSVVNSADEQATVCVNLPGKPDGKLVDLLASEMEYRVIDNRCEIRLPPNCGRILRYHCGR